jgi:nickel/cobalt transporter (NiCoT) family protein
MRRGNRESATKPFVTEELAMSDMASALRDAFSDSDTGFRRKVVGLYGFLVICNVAAWTWAVTMFSGNAVLLGAAVLAYTFGLRHAFDADHIAAIDSATRKLMQRKARPTGVGFYFALGHSAALFVFVGIIAAWGAWDGKNSSFNFINSSAGLASTFVSTSFLIIMAALNLTIAWSTYQTFRHVRRGGRYVEEDLEILLNKRGFMSRILRPLFRLIDKSWHMIFIGFLFGLGFDTATEVALLGIAGAEAAKGLSVWVIMAFPAVFAAGMTLMDTTDSVLMVRAYGWALRNPMRKLYYNMSITLVSAAVALTIAGIEALALLSEQFELKGWIWDWANSLNDHWELVGIFIVALFVACWGSAVLLYRFKFRDGEPVAIPVLNSDA